MKILGLFVLLVCLSHAYGSPSQYSHIVFVDKSGNDATADGSQYPFATVDAALTYAATLASVSFRVAVKVGPGTFGSGAVLPMVANVGLVGELEAATRLNYQFNVNHPSWAVSGDNRAYFEHLVLAGPSSTFDFTTQSSVEGKLYLFSARVNNDLTFIAFYPINQVCCLFGILFGGRFFGGVFLEHFQLCLLKMLNIGIH